MFWPKKMIIRVVLMSTLRIMSRRGQGHCLTFDLGLSHYDNFKHLLKATGPIVTKSHLEPPGADGKKIFSNPIVHMTNTPHPYMVKSFKNLQLQNQLIDDLAT